MLRNTHLGLTSQLSSPRPGFHCRRRAAAFPPSQSSQHEPIQRSPSLQLVFLAVGTGHLPQAETLSHPVRQLCCTRNMGLSFAWRTLFGHPFWLGGMSRQASTKKQGLNFVAGSVDMCYMLGIVSNHWRVFHTNWRVPLEWL